MSATMWTYGPTAHAVAARVAAARKRQGLTLRQLSITVSEYLSRSVTVSALSKIENCSRRVDVDELVALADCLEVTPLDLLGGLGPAGEKFTLDLRLRVARSGDGRRVREAVSVL